MLTSIANVRKVLRLPWSGFWLRLRAGLALSAILIALLGLLLRLTVRDGYWPLAFVFYATPPAVLSGLCLLAAACLGWKRRRRMVLVLLGCGLLTATWTYRTMWHGGAAAGSSHGTVRIALWNACRGNLGWDGATKAAGRLDADILCLVEAGPGHRKQQQVWAEAFPEHNVSRLWNGTLVLSRYPVEILEIGFARKSVAFQVCRVETPTGPLVLALADLYSDPLRWRRDAFTQLQALIDRYADERFILLGDFNTPPDSVFFDSFRPTVRSAFETSGDGYAATWPQPLPVLALDQVWTTDQVNVTSCRAAWMWRSDHRAVVCEVE